MRRDPNTTRSWLIVVALLLSPTLLADDSADRRSRINDLSAEEKNDLLRKSNRFYAMSSSQQQRLWNLHQQLEKDPHAGQLRETLRRYVEWLKTLDPVQQAELQGLSPQQRIEKIKELRGQQPRRDSPILANRKIPPQDLRVAMNWLDEFIQTHEDEIAATMPKRFQFQLRNAQPESRSRMLRVAYFHAVQINKNIPRPGMQEMQQLSQRVSEPTRQVLESPQARHKLLEWFAEFAMIRRISEVELRDFFQDHLSEDERRRIDNLPVEERKMLLRRMYIEHQRGKRGFPRAADDQRNGQRPGAN